MIRSLGVIPRLLVMGDVSGVEVQHTPTTPRTKETNNGQ